MERTSKVHDVSANPPMEQETTGLPNADSDEQQDSKNIENIVPFYKLFSFADGADFVLMAVGAVAALASGVSSPLMIIIFGDIMDALGETTNTNEIVSAVSKVAVRFIYLGVGTCVASFLQMACWTITGERQASRIRHLYLRSLLRQDVAFFDRETRTGEVVGRIEKVGQFIQYVSSFIGGFVWAFSIGWQLALVMLATIPFVGLAAALMANVMTKMAARGQAAYSEAAATVEQTIGAIRTVAAFTGEEEAMNKYNISLKSAYKSSVLEGLAAGAGMGATFGLIYIGYALGVWFGAKMIIDKGYSGGVVIKVIALILVGSMSLGQASPATSAFAAGQAAAFKMFETINRKPEIDSCDTSGRTLDEIQGDIELRDVCFSYPARPNEPVFSGLSLFIPGGRSFALVGGSGSGKSTVISLIERFYDPQSGKVLIDGIDIKDFQLKWIRGKIGLVSQEPVLFASSIRDNIAYGKENATVEEIRAAAELANATKFIDKLPQGLDTLVGEHGTKLSGGQKQRVAIARAILKDPRILLLDEATSALDAESERVVQEALDRVMTNRITTVIVAHRLSTVQNADMITVLHEGSLLEQEYFESPSETYPEDSKLQKTNSQNSSRENQEVPFSRLASLNKPELPVILLGVVAAVISGVILPFFSIIFSGIVHAFYESTAQLQKDAKFWSLLFIALGFTTFIAIPARSYFFAVAGCKLIKRIRAMTFDKVVHMEVGWFDESENSIGVIGARLSADAAAVRSLVGDSLALMVQNAATLISGLVIAFVSCWQLALVILALVPLMALNSLIQVKFMKGSNDNAKVMHEGASQVASGAIGSIRTVASFSAEEKILELYKMKCEGSKKAGIRRGLISGIGFGISFLMLYCGYATSFFAGARLIGAGKTTFSDVYRSFLALSLAAIGLSHSSSLLPDATKAKSATASVFAILDRKSKIDSSDNNGVTLERVVGNIEFKDVKFSYPTRPDVQIFQGLCLHVPSGKSVALVGESGSGKSTAISLLQRFYDPDSGRILLDGLEIQKFQLRWLRQQMGLVSQEPILFNDTIRANIAYGKGGDASEAEIFAAAELANAHQFISSLHQGYETVVGERGVQLSGGQKQRIAIARAIIKEPKILLLDEATSALDAESERVVQDALDRVMLNRTTFIVAHRLSTIRGVDFIAVIKNGVVSEEGSHAALMKIEKGAYASLVALHASPLVHNPNNSCGLSEL
ncbi:hypothetical protein J5N97_014206 [Dioscorea zingiberensis]|uniref:Uncharacterized protein n=1 Tax=Dioscorea zingiberensis TaxID=325984 RepID=A0A9D5CUC4_9LILI|nr:hypothetical protein J5N97_014206 [Dioscorea zingiberensis]